MQFNQHEFERQLEHQLNGNKANHEDECPLMYGDEVRPVVQGLTLPELLAACGGWMWQIAKKSDD